MNIVLANIDIIQESVNPADVFVCCCVWLVLHSLRIGTRIAGRMDQQQAYAAFTIKLDFRVPQLSTWKGMRGLKTSFSATAASSSSHNSYLKAVNRPNIHLHHHKTIAGLPVGFGGHNGRIATSGSQHPFSAGQDLGCRTHTGSVP